eukprot:SAG25_NODE_9212_length_382_cov_1.070671_1_plen_81_part_10
MVGSTVFWAQGGCSRPKIRSGFRIRAQKRAESSGYIGSRATLDILKKRDRKEQVKDGRKEKRELRQPRSERYDSSTALARK